MHATVDHHRDTSYRADLAEDVAFIVMILSGLILAVVLIVAAFVI